MTGGSNNPPLVGARLNIWATQCSVLLSKFNKKRLPDQTGGETFPNMLL